VEKNQTVELDEIKNLLRAISTKSPENIDILHALAALARYEGDTSSEMDYYRQVLKLDSTESIAHLNLGYLYYHQEDGYEQAEYHFRQFLELEPEAENREAIEDLLKSFNLKE
jgi:tetratricopeptide (TPR) repeat protein